MPTPSAMAQMGQGILERLSYWQDYQRQQDNQKKAETIQMLSGLADKIEPESLPALWSHIGDVINIKPKGLRNIWDAIGQMPDRSVQDQLSDKAREVQQQFVGPSTARAQRGQAVVNQALDTFAGGPVQSPQTLNQAAGLDNKIVMRDPLADQLKLYQAHFGTMAQSREAIERSREEARAALESEQAKHKIELVDCSKSFRTN